MENDKHIKYTYIHRKIVIYLANKYVKKDKEKILKQIEKHDVDKLFMYLFYSKNDVSRFHRELSSHHENDIEKTEIDYIEMVLDWESARYTKPDKPLNAYDTLYKYYPNLENKIMPILNEFGINQTNLPMEKDVIEYANTIKDTTMLQIKIEMKEYLDKLIPTTDL